MFNSQRGLGFPKILFRSIIVFSMLLMAILWFATSSGTATTDDSLHLDQLYSAQVSPLPTATFTPDWNEAPVIETIALEPSDGVISVGAPVNFTATFTKNHSGEHHAHWYYGDGSHTFQFPVQSPIQVSHTYSEAGIYQASVWIGIWNGLHDSATYDPVVVYEPDGGFVTGGGWFESPAGAYRADPGAAGRALFRFNSRYDQGTNVPIGSADLRLHFAGFRFQATEYDWLFVDPDGTTAQFGGTGTINGEVAPNGDRYHFALWATDGAQESFRAKIWYQDSSTGEVLVYDNAAEQEIGAGAIVIHSGR